MITLCCYSTLQPETEAALSYATHRVDTSGDPCAYWRTLSSYWGMGQDIMLIEHDIVPPSDAVKQFRNCPEPWCVFPYPVDADAMLCHSLGCTRFRTQIQLPLPAGQFTWNEVDGAVREAVLGSGIAHPHVHFPPARHLNPAVRQPADLEALWHQLYGGTARNCQPAGCDGYVVAVSSCDWGGGAEGPP